ERRPVELERGRFTEAVELAEHRPAAWPELSRASQLEIGIGVRELLGHALRSERGALFLHPLLAPLGGQIVAQAPSKRDQMGDIVERVRLLLASERPSRPVVLLP